MRSRGVVELVLVGVQVYGIVLVTGMSEVWVELRAPRFVVHRNSAVLRCEHNVDPESLYKVVFFKNGQRIMKFVRGRDPPYEPYNFTGADINLFQLSPTSITLERMDFSASGPYACEIALETPLYSKVSKIHELSVIVRQKHRPKIKIRHKKLSSNDHLEATCQSAPAHPAPHLTWFINNMKVDERLTVPHGTVNVHRHHHGMPLSVTNSSLHFPLATLQLYPNQTIDITCLSTIPSYANLGEGFADVQNHTVTVNVVRIEPTPTQLPVKIVSEELNSSCRCTIHRLVLIALLLVCHFSF
ncbi:uncharacterized protein LOC113512496 [Galleria mellonella]|uniref:Uncharacterized protein LOC113512496 n=1 Tax=Galleria mellonella TaxID=7137 RepID=A0ABM3MTF9_GALME|nr:uncharacterized protein LOC113512496 [Galleria mellonella]XP_052754649.1 uncharacterized protein LOC113512496 [Galleria mellonella]XP_052754650.1 uncharacterized protein LOC113512496 [Galleria mellonella]